MRGKYIYSDGSEIEVKFENNKAQSFKKITYANGSIYKGETKGFSTRHGQGKAAYPNGATFEGEWKDDKKHGQGKYTDLDGNIQEGEWKEDSFVGK